MRKMNFDDNWRFYKGDLEPHTPADGWGGAKAGAYNFGATKFDLDDSKWRGLCLPHDFDIEGDYTKNSADADMQAIPEMESIDSRHFAGGSLAGGVAWYRKHFTIADDIEGKRVILHFDGVYRDSCLYLNQYFVGHHTSGYTPFAYDITDFIDVGGENVLAMRVDSTGREGWWYEGGGIYRHAWLEVTGDIHFAKDGVFIAPEVDLDKRAAFVRIGMETESRRVGDAYITAEAEIYNAEGRLLKTVSVDKTAEAWETTKIELGAELTDVRLWDTDDPYLYRAAVRLYDGDRLLDEEILNFGCRTAVFDADQGFLLNGRKVVIKGVCCHHDHAGVGMAIPDSVHEYRLARMKQMGANAFRGAHSSVPAAVLDLCDRMGILVFDETRRMSASEEDLRCLRATVRTGRNHPSVILWGIGNEEIFVEYRSETKRCISTMLANVKKLDPTRAVTMAAVCWDGKRRYENARGLFGTTSALDVMGFNYCKEAWDDYHEHNPKQPIIVTEESVSGSTRGCFSTDEAAGLYYAYDPDNAEKCKSGWKAVRRDIGEDTWKYVAEREYLAGLFIWTGIDYRGEPTPLAYPSVYSHFGATDYCAFPKDAFYYYRSWWQDKDVLHLFPHWTHPGEEGKPFAVYCFGNTDEAELFVNGKSYGRKALERNGYLKWDGVVYEPGELRAVGYRAGAEVKTEIVTTAGAPHAIKAEAYKPELCAGDTAIVNIDIVDRNGNFVPYADTLLHFRVTGGTLTGTGNGGPADHDPDNAPLRRAFNGKCQLLAKADKAGVMRVEITSAALGSTVCEITVNRRQKPKKEITA